jgi:uncharacterized protein YndB with AHSA1/START domain
MKIAGLLAALSLAALADEPKWEKKEFECVRPEKGCHITTCCQYGLAVYTREKPGVDVREVKAVGQVDAPPARVFEVVTDYEHQVGNMPYVEKQNVFSRTDNDVTFWAVADFPFVSRRDWIVKSKLEKNLPGGVYRAAWDPAEVPNAPPPGDGVVRLKINTGSWTLEPIDGGQRTLATYQLLTDPGGSIPSFIANKANTTALPELFARVRKRAEAK